MGVKGIVETGFKGFLEGTWWLLAKTINHGDFPAQNGTMKIDDLPITPW